MALGEFGGQVLFSQRGPFRKKSGFENIAERWYRYFWKAILQNSLRGQSLHVWRGHDESGPVLGLKLLVGPRWREFHCLAAPPLSL